MILVIERKRVTALVQLSEFSLSKYLKISQKEVIVWLAFNIILDDVLCIYIFNTMARNEEV